MASVLSAIGSWISGVAFPSIINFFVEGVAIVVSFIGSPLGAVLLLVFAIALITAAVIAYYKGFFNTVKQKYENVNLVDEKKIFEQLDSHKGEAANLETQLTFFEKDINEEVNNLISEEKIEDNKTSSMNIFINTIIDLIKKAGNGGENTCKKNFKLCGDSCASLLFKYNKDDHQATLTFSFYDEILFEYLILLLKMIIKKGYNLQNKNYEEEFKNFDIDRDSVNIYKLKITNI